MSINELIIDEKYKFVLTGHISKITNIEHHGNCFWCDCGGQTKITYLYENSYYTTSEDYFLKHHRKIKL